MKYLIARYDVDADIEPIYRTRQDVAKFANEGNAILCCQVMQRETPGQVRGMFVVQQLAGKKDGEQLYRTTYSAR